MFTVNKNPSRSQLRWFGLAMFAGFGLIGIVAWGSQWFQDWDQALLGFTAHWTKVAAACAWIVGTGLLGVSLGPAWVARPVYVGWMTASAAIGLVFSTVLLTVLFVLFLPPFSLVVRLGDPLRKKLGRVDTYWEPYKAHEPTLERMRRMF